jgi:hypothetical protein
VKYEVDYTWVGKSAPGDQEPDDINAPDMADEIRAFYQSAALRGGRVIASHTLILEDQEHLFFVSEFPDEP